MGIGRVGGFVTDKRTNRSRILVRLTPNVRKYSLPPHPSLHLWTHPTPHLSSLFLPLFPPNSSLTPSLLPFAFSFFPLRLTISFLPHSTLFSCLLLFTRDTVTVNKVSAQHVQRPRYEYVLTDFDCYQKDPHWVRLVVFYL